MIRINRVPLHAERFGGQMSSEGGLAEHNSGVAQAMDVDYGHVDVGVVSSGGIKVGDVHSVGMASVSGGPNVILVGDKGQRSSTAGQIEPWSMDEDSELPPPGACIHFAGRWAPYLLPCSCRLCRSPVIWFGFACEAVWRAHQTLTSALHLPRSQAPAARQPAWPWQLERHLRGPFRPLGHALQAALGDSGLTTTETRTLFRASTGGTSLACCTRGTRGSTTVDLPAPHGLSHPCVPYCSLPPYPSPRGKILCTARDSHAACLLLPREQVDPSILKTPWTDEEDKKIVVAQSKLGNRFAEIAKILDGR